MRILGRQSTDPVDGQTKGMLMDSDLEKLEAMFYD